jgi:D-alanyl-D-alanine carboxypeptidase
MKVIATLLVCPALLVSHAFAANAPDSLAEALRTDLQQYLASRRAAEHISAVSLSVSLPGQPQNIDATAGTARFGAGAAVTPASLYQIGSNTKAFTAVTLLQLEAEGKLNINDTVGRFLPQYPLWREVSIKRLLNMTSGIPGYDTVDRMLKDYAAAPAQDLSVAQLISYVYPTNQGAPPATTGWSYSNTNYLLAQLIIEKVTGHSYGDELRRRFFATPALRQSDTFYAANRYPAGVTSRMVSGYFFSNTPDNAGLALLYGKDVRDASVSWMQAAGGIVSTPTDVTHWVRALYQGGVLKQPQQQELESLVSLESGKPIADVSAADPRGFGLGVGRNFIPAMGKFWFYEGMTLGYRMIYVWFTESDVVIAVGINSQPNAEDNHARELTQAIYGTLHQAGKL